MKPFEYMRMTIKFKVLESEVYSYFLGSFIRGNFGMYLKKTICPFGMRRSCENCLIQKKCFYAEIFESQSDTSTSGRNIPHPFVIDVLEEDDMDEKKNGDLSFDIILFGPALKNYEFFILVFSEMGKKGIGKNRIKCQHVIIDSHEGHVIYSSEKEKILRSPKISTFEFSAKEPTNHLKVTYLSPLRLKRERVFVTTPDFESLIRSSLRRLFYLEEHYGTVTDLPTKEIIEESTKVKTAATDLRWVQRVRYSNRRKYRMNLGGLMGTQEFEGIILPLHIDLLRFASIFHLGKSSTFGHGKIEVIK